MKKNGMFEGPRQEADINVIAYAMLIACAFVGLCIRAGYNVGRDMVQGTF